MQAYHMVTTISSGGTLTIKELPLRAGERVEVIVRKQEPETDQTKRYPLRGKPVRYVDPFKGVALSDGLTCGRRCGSA